MKKLLVLLFLSLFSSQVINAHPIPVTLSNGQVVYIESDDFKDTQAILDYINQLEEEIRKSTFVPGIGQTQG